MRKKQSQDGKAQTGLGWLFGPRGIFAAAIPDFEYRPAQLQMAEAVERAIDTGETLLAEAGTGTTAGTADTGSGSLSVRC